MRAHGIYRSPAGRARIADWCRAQLDAWPLAHETVTIPTRIGETFAVVAGSGPAVLLLPGTNFSVTTWLELVEALATRHRVIAVDLPGQPGESDPHRPGHPSAYGDWLGSVVRELGLSGAPVVGHSLGGLVALAGAARGADVGRLLLFNPAGLARLRVTAPVLGATLPWLVRPTLDSATRLVAVLTTRPVPLSLATWMALVGREVRTSLAPAPLPDAALRRVEAPVRIFAAERDPFLPPRVLDRGAARLLGAAVHPVAGAGHLLPHERPDLVVAAVSPGDEGSPAPGG